MGSYEVEVIFKLIIGLFLMVLCDQKCIKTVHTNNNHFNTKNTVELFQYLNASLYDNKSMMYVYYLIGFIDETGNMT